MGRFQAEARVDDALAPAAPWLAEIERLKGEVAIARARVAGLEARADVDSQLDILNRRGFERELERARAHLQRYGTQAALMFIDLDGFKNVNDTHGHDFGDRVLLTTAKRLKSMVRSGDTVSRRSGDEFLFLMLEVKDEASVLAMASRIATELGQACDVEGQSVRISASVGIVVYPEDGRSAAELLQRADAAMYAAKHNGAGPALYSQIDPITVRQPA